MARKPRGRPPFAPTTAQRRQVGELLACSMSKKDIARVLGIHEETLEKHFGEELATGAAKRRAEVIGLLFKNARAGNVSAQKKLEEMSGQAVAAASFDQPEAGRRAAPPAAKPKGKKEAAAEAALTAGQGSDWGEDLAFVHKPN